jgi:hypothetical protein
LIGPAQINGNSGFLVGDGDGGALWKLPHDGKSKTLRCFSHRAWKSKQQLFHSYTQRPAATKLTES